MEQKDLIAIRVAGHQWMSKLFPSWDGKCSLYGLFEHQNAAKTLQGTEPFEDALAQILTRPQRKALMNNTSFKKAYQAVYWYSFSREYDPCVAANINENCKGNRYQLSRFEACRHDSKSDMYDNFQTKWVQIIPHFYGQLVWFEIIALAPISFMEFPLIVRWKNNELYSIRCVSSLTETYYLRQAMQRPVFLLGATEIMRGVNKQLEFKSDTLKQKAVLFAESVCNISLDDDKVSLGKVINAAYKISLKNWQKFFENECPECRLTAAEKRQLKGLYRDFLPAVYHLLNNLQRRFKKPSCREDALSYNKWYLDERKDIAVVADFNRGWYVRVYMQSRFKFDYPWIAGPYFITVKCVEEFQQVPELWNLLLEPTDSKSFLTEMKFEYV